MYISIDIGGTNIRIAKSNALTLDAFEYTLLRKYKLTHNYKLDIQDIIKLLSKENNIAAISIGIAGKVNLPEWENKKYRERLSKRFNCTVVVNNDAHIGALGFKYFSKIQVPPKFLYLTWGTGIGGVIVENKSNKTKITKIDYQKYRKDFEMLYGGKNLQIKYGENLSALGKEIWSEIFKGFELELLKLAKSFKLIPIAIGGGASSRHINELNEISTNLQKHSVSLYISNLGDDIGIMGGFACLYENLKN